MARIHDPVVGPVVSRVTAARVAFLDADAAGTTQPHVAAIENGRRQPSHPALARLLRAAGFELRTRLEPFDPHDETIEEWLRAQPVDFQRRWAEHQRMIGGIAAELHGATIAMSFDLDVTPGASWANRVRIARALAELNATLRVPGGMPDDVEVHIDADWLERVTTATFNTDHGPFDLAFRPDGTDGYDDLVRSVVIVRVGAVDARLASLEDIVRSKTAAGRTKAELTLPAPIDRLKAIRADQTRSEPNAGTMRTRVSRADRIEM